ncbi:MAG TPA: FAD-binding oxidoreductase [Kofleriaceae bacterium]|nr:FAD-binding oxidoreductase [Kofleriaceae bacterium]
MTDRQRTGEAISAWRGAIGDGQVVDDEARLAAVARTTFALAPGHAPVAWLRPADREQVAACVRIAAAHGVPLHPVSRGRNLGYGSRAPARPGAALLDLARLDRIVDFDERMAYVTVEPGVTFRQLADFLRGCRARVFAGVTGGPADASVVANALERGDGSGPLADRFAHVCDLEVVLPTGERIETGFGRFGGAVEGTGGAAVAPLGRWGVGPSLDGLFSQSGLGVVTRATIWLTPYPRHFELGWFTADDGARLPALVDGLRRLKLAGVVRATTPVWNDCKILPLFGGYPFAETGGATPLPADVRAELRRRARVGAWNGTLSLYGASTRHAVALRECVEEELRPLVTSLRFDRGPDEPLDADPARCGPALGVPHDQNLVTAYWRKPGPPAPPLDPDADGCGMLWLSHAVPFAGDHAAAVAALVEEEVTAGGYEPALALLGVTERVLYAVVSLAYDRDLPGEDARARACHDRTFARLVERGYPPFRTGVQGQGLAPAGDPAYQRVLDALAVTLDPAGVLAPGRYPFSPRE